MFVRFVQFSFGMEIFLQLVISTLIPGTLFALVALGFTLVSSVSRFLHLAHGAVVLASGYSFYALVVGVGLSPLVAAAITSVGAAFLGSAMNTVVYERFRKGRTLNAIVTLIVAIALMMLLENILLFVFGSQTKIVPVLLEGSVSLRGAVLTLQEIWIMSLSLAFFFFTYCFWRFSRFGRCARAVADNEEAAEIIGIATTRVRTGVFALASFLAGIAGVFFAIEYGLQPGLTTALAIKAFGRAVIGGIGSVPGALVGSILLDAVEVAGAWFWNSAYKEVVSFVMVFLFLLYRPSGLFGRK